LKKSISYWAFPGGGEGKANIAKAMRQAKEAGFEAMELCIAESGALSLSSAKADCTRIRKTAEKVGIEIASVATGIYWGYNFASPTAAERRKAIAATKKMLNITAWLGTDALLVIPGSVDVFFSPTAPVIPYDVVYQRVREGIGKVLSTAKKCKVAVSVENVWNSFLQSPLELRDLVDSFRSRYVGVYFDVGNVLRFGFPEQWISILGKRIKRVHLKDFKKAVGTIDGFVDLLGGDVDWPEVIKALKKVGYDGPLTAEMFPYAHHPQVLIKNTSNAMDAILGRC